MITTNTRRAIGTLSRIIGGLDAAVEAGLEALAERGADVARAKSTGSVRGSIVTRKVGSSVEIAATAPHATFVEHGRGAIVAKGKALRFEVNGTVVFAKRVGPARARPFMAPAGVAMTREATMSDEIAKLIR
jgi:hypothetical protein